MSKNETWRTRKYWETIGGLLIEEYYAIQENKKMNTAKRIIDGIIVLGEKKDRKAGGTFEFKGCDIIVISDKIVSFGNDSDGAGIFFQGDYEKI
jgi:hypothetical protein